MQTYSKIHRYQSLFMSHRMNLSKPLITNDDIVNNLYQFMFDDIWHLRIHF